jgi:hypothetical protein
VVVVVVVLVEVTVAVEDAVACVVVVVTVVLVEVTVASMSAVVVAVAVVSNVLGVTIWLQAEDISAVGKGNQGGRPQSNPRRSRPLGAVCW